MRLFQLGARELVLGSPAQNGGVFTPGTRYVTVVYVRFYGVLVATFLSDARQPEVDFLHSFEKIFGQIVSIRVQTLSHTNLVASRRIKREKKLTSG